MILGCEKQDVEWNDDDTVTVKFSFESKESSSLKLGVGHLENSGSRYYKIDNATAVKVDVINQSKFFSAPYSKQASVTPEIESLNQNIPVRIMAFDNETGNFVSEIYHEVGSSAAEMKLKPGRHYRFVALTYNVKAQIYPNQTEVTRLYPNVVFVDSLNKKINDAFVVGTLVERGGVKTLTDAPNHQIPVYHFIDTTADAIVSNSTINMVVKFEMKSHGETHVVLDESDSPYASLELVGSEITSDNIFYTDNPSYKLETGALVKSYEGTDFRQSLRQDGLISHLYYPYRWVYHMDSDDMEAVFKIRFSAREPNSTTTVRKTVVLNNFPLRNGYRQYVHVKVMPIADIPASASFEYESLPDITNDVYWN